ncbi:MAG: 30S ribosome-binding factor RbfA [Planctomycetales bacterium]|nr:30S ribosome-binding factor RbfA [Planctomycetales bacterium]
MGVRAERLAQFIKEEVAEILQRQISDPRIQFVSVTRVQLSADLRFAKVYVSMLGSEGARTAAMTALEHARGRIQALVAPRIQARFCPRIDFSYDPGLAEAVRVSKIIDEAVKEDRERQKARGEAPPAPAKPPPPKPRTRTSTSTDDDEDAPAKSEEE